MTTEELKAACELAISLDHGGLLRWRNEFVLELARAFLAQQEALRVAKDAIFQMRAAQEAVGKNSLASIREIEGEQSKG